LKGNPDYQLLYTIPGIGPINALTILAEAGDLRHFQHHRQFLKFCGMDLHNQSGMFRGQTKLSKYGNARLRRTLWMAAQVAILQRANSFRDKFERYITKDATTPIYAARRLQQSPQRWPGPCMRLLKAVNPIAPSLRGRSTAEGPFSYRAVEALVHSATS
jgi:transposase